MKKVLTPFRVGLLVLASGAFLFVFLTFVKKGGLSEKESIRVYAYFRDASGLGKKSRVQIAGIWVGDIDDISLEGTRAKVYLKIRRDVGLREDATLTKRSESLLGDYMLDLSPGSESSPPLANGAELRRVIDAQGMEAIFGSLSQITADIQQVTGSLREVLGGDAGTNSLGAIVENMVKLSTTVDATVQQSAGKLDAILSNFETVSADIRGITQGEEGTVRVILNNVEAITRDVRDVLADVKQAVGSGEGDLKDTMGGLRSTMARLDRTLQNLEEVTTKVKEGKGPAGALLADERLGQKLADTVEDVSAFASSLTSLQTEVGVKSDYLFSQGQAKNFLAIRLIPKPDKYYLLEFVDDPRGLVETQVVQANPPSTGEPVTQIQKITRDQLKISAQFAKRFYFTTLRFGIIESTGGLGTDFSFLNDSLTLKLDAFNFSVEELRYPRLRASLRLVLYQHLFINAGMDDMLNRQVRDAQTNRLIAGRDLFLGAGITFTDDDLKAVLVAAPVPSP